MLIVYLRSSSYKQEKSCPHSYFLRYVLGQQETANKSAIKGVVVHKALELLGLVNKYTKEKIQSFDDDLLGKLDVETCTPQFCITQSFNAINSDGRLLEKDFKDCTKWMWKVLDDNDGMFDPRKLDIVDCEVQFDIEIKEPWSYYKYSIKDVKLEGHLKLKGTMDLVVNHGDGVIEIIDWKTGQFKNWDEDRPLTYDDLKVDAQLHIYYYAARQLYPNAKLIMLTIHYMNDGGPRTLYYDDTNYEYAKQLIKQKFEKIKSTVKPQKVITWKCKRLCHYGKNLQPGTNLTICEHFTKEIQNKGMTKVVEENLYNIDHLVKYGEGGGRGK